MNKPLRTHKHLIFSFLTARNRDESNFEIFSFMIILTNPQLTNHEMKERGTFLEIFACSQNQASGVTLDLD